MESYADLRITFADSSLNLGGRVPLHPAAKDGVVLELGSSAPHSPRLQELERETSPLRRLNSCSYKKTSEERGFRYAGFSIDWCSFRIFDTLPKNKGVDTRPTELPTPLVFTERCSINRSPNTALLLLCVSVPVLLLLLFMVLLAVLLLRDCCSKEKTSDPFIDSLFSLIQDCFSWDKQGASEYSKDSKVLLLKPSGVGSKVNLTSSVVDIRSARASSVQRQTDTLKSLGKRRAVSPRLQSSPDPPSFSAPSRTASPSPCPG